MEKLDLEKYLDSLKAQGIDTSAVEKRLGEFISSNVLEPPLKVQ